ncbi:MAG: DUF1624 domain-containing protein [Myxococcales bacterium]|nr:DUF1624 domain-containing protein [Myxococcales bacterium]
MGDVTVDNLRGLAIGAMVWGHLGVAIYHPEGRGEPETALVELPPLWTEVIGGAAPPLFLFVSGMMVHYVAQLGSPLRRQLLRMLGLLAVGAGIDVLFWRIRPFTTVDVLYCIALVLPLTHLFVRLVPHRAKAPLAALVLAITPWLQRVLGYSDYPTEMSLGGHVFQTIKNQTSILHHWLIDGWFPLFPWLGFALLGAFVAERRFGPVSASQIPPSQITLHRPDRLLGGLGAASLTAGLLLGWPDSAARIEARLRVGGAFMPPDAGYLLVSVGLVGLALVTLDALPHLAALRPIELLGNHPLLVYVGHFPLVKIVARLLPQRLTLLPTILVILTALGAMALGLLLWRRLLGLARERWSPTR